MCVCVCVYWYTCHQNENSNLMLSWMRIFWSLLSPPCTLQMQKQQQDGMLHQQWWWISDIKLIPKSFVQRKTCVCMPNLRTLVDKDTCGCLTPRAVITKHFFHGHADLIMKMWIYIIEVSKWRVFMDLSTKHGFSSCWFQPENIYNIYIYT